MSKAVVLLYSGGMDSTTVLYALRAEGIDVVPLFMSYGQRHRNDEYMAAATLAGELKLMPLIAELSVSHLWKNNALTGNMLLPEAGIGPGVTVVPGRNLLFISLANILAMTVGADAIAIGCNGDDAEVYEDCREEFLARAEATIGRPIRRPLIGMTKEEVARLGETLGVPLERTWSCYAGGPAQCGRCDACVRRANALEALDRSPFAARVG